MIKLRYPVLMASNSPRRKELMEKLQIPFSVQVVEVDETIPTNTDVQKVAIHLAETKSMAHAHLAQNTIVVTSDTVVIYNNKILGKPASEEGAFDMLKTLSGKTHQVITGVCLRCNDKVVSFDVSTRVTFGPLSENEINYYINSGHATDKAGAYGIQDWIGMIGVKSIEGSYYNVMGLPVHELYEHLKNF